MRAEMTVGLDLKSLENLRIVNGYGDVKRERKLSFEAPSSPEDNASNAESDGPQDVSSTSSAKAKGRSKCGRPANPIPRHKRDSHIKAEYKRRDKIQKGFDTLLSMVPELTEASSSKESRSSMLFKTTEYCRQLKSECGSAQTEISALRQELEALGTEIQDLQDKLPQHGAKPSETKELSMDTLYDQYVAEETKKNWKFWIFGFFMRPLYDSYKQTTSKSQKSDQFNNTLMEWVQDRLSLKNLRKGFLDSLRYISKHTGIMSNPEDIEHEAKTRVHDHFLCRPNKQQSPAPSLPPSPLSPISPRGTTVASLSRVSTPAGTPRVVTPVSGTPKSHTPLPGTPLRTPNPTPPRTPNVSRRSSRRENVRPTETRSRSNSPDTAETKPKRRSSYRSRSGKRSSAAPFTEPERKMEYTITPPQSTQLPFSHYMVIQSSPSTTATQQPIKKQEIPVTVTTASTNQSSISIESHIQNTLASMNEDVISTFVQSLISAMEPHTTLPVFDAIITEPSTMSPDMGVSTVNSTNMSGASALITNSQTPTFSTMSDSKVAMDHHISSTTSPSGANFVPLDKSVVIADGLLMHVDDNSNDATNYHDKLISDFLSSPTQVNNIPKFTPDNLLLKSEHTDMYESLSEASETSHSSLVTGSDDCHPYESEINSTNEDSLMGGMLTIDVLDVDAVMNFFKSDTNNS